MSEPVLELRSVGFGYAGREVLRGITLALEAGSATALIGANGVGKTTLLRVASGALRPTAGEVLLEGRLLRTFERRELARRMAVVPQRLQMAFAFTVRQMVEQGRTPYLSGLWGLGRADRLAVERAMEMADVGGLAERVFNQLSGGERQRVKIALGLAQEPRVLLLDEPTQNLDIGRAGELMDLLSTLKAEGITVLASMHDLHLIRGRFDRVVMLGPAMQMVEGTVDEVMSGERLEWGFDCPPGGAELGRNGIGGGTANAGVLRFAQDDGLERATARATVDSLQE